MVRGARSGMLAKGLSGKRLKLGFVGCGEHAKTNLYPCLRYVPVDLVSICAKHRESAESAAKIFGADSAYDDFQEMFDKETLDAVFVCVGAKEHFRICSAALESGLHVFVEKPATKTLEEAIRLREIEKRANRHVMVGFMKRHAPGYRKAKEIVESGSFVPLAALDTKLCVGPFWGEEEFLLEVAIHHLDLVRFFAGEVQSLHVEKHASKRQGVFTLAVVVRFQSGAVGSLCFSTEQSWRAHNERVELSGNEQFVVIDNVFSLRHYKPSRSNAGEDVYSGMGNAFWEPNFTVPSSQNQTLHLNGFGFEVEHFVKSLLSGKKPKPDLRDFIMDMLLIEAILGRKSIEKGPLCD
jgi:myo-inositol 2-dehydrogenase/D-chiro-inositol 1-dehydrogenase